MAKKLTDKQKRFADEYLIDLNATQAAIRAGYSEKTAEQMGYKLVQNSLVSEYIQQQQKRLQKKTNITQERVLAELEKIGFASITDYLEYKTIIREVEKDRDGNPQYDWAMSVLARDSTEVDGAPIQEVSIGKDGTFKFKLYDKVKALEQIGRHLGLFDKGSDGGDAEDLSPLVELLRKK